MPRVAGLGEACCGCGACAAVCPKGCVGMGADVLGFRRSSVDADICVGCGMCERACPVLSKRDDDAVEAAWWARADDTELLSRSSSGGLFGLLSRLMLSQGGVVYGAAFEDDCKAVRHVRVDASEGLDAVMRSKYVQSSVGCGVYKGIEADLRAERPVLFAGTACQVSGICGYLDARRVSKDGLLLVDVICHGVPSPRLWSEWLSYKEDAASSEVRCANFRSKSSGWTTFSVAYEYATEKVESGRFGDDWYMEAFLSNASLRGSCFACPAKRSCGSDLTLGDFWGVQSFHPEAYDERGVSAVIANTTKGHEAIEALGAHLVMGESSFEKVATGNSALVRSVSPYHKRGAFLAALSGGVGLPALTRRWPSFKPPLLRRVIGKLKHLVKRVIGRD
ncbi:MAG: Coenzyme F420 hydrogenase/dehydrogenase, beta subunit C-terminal domain [Coriobacteriia bacterium]